MVQYATIANVTYDNMNVERQVRCKLQYSNHLRDRIDVED